MYARQTCSYTLFSVKILFNEEILCILIVPLKYKEKFMDRWDTYYGVHPFSLYRNKSLDESCTQVHITVEQDTSLNTSEARFPLESPCVARTCPRRNIFPRENIVLPGNPRSTNGCLRSYPMMVLSFSLFSDLW